MLQHSATGAIHAQLLDSIFPGTVALHKIKWQARLEPEYIHNFKVVQEAMDKKDLAKPLPVDRLIKGKYQDNFEMLQWFHAFWQARHSGHAYDAKLVRLQSSKGKDFVPPSQASGPATALPAATTAAATTVPARAVEKHAKTSGRAVAAAGVGSKGAAVATSLDQSFLAPDQDLADISHILDSSLNHSLNASMLR
jgi:RP/EB family microtubule-associated protein